MLIRRLSLLTFLLGLVIAVPDDAPADAMSLAARAPLLGNRVALVSLTAPDPAQAGGRAGGSLFAGTAGRSLFAPYPVRQRGLQGAAPRLPDGNQAAALTIPATGGAADRVRHLIAAAEAGKAGYDAVNYGARIRPQRPPTAMTLAEIEAWIAATPGQPHAIGRYQFIPATLRRLVAMKGLHAGTRFTPQVQDALADILLVEAGFNDLQRGAIQRRTFMNNLAKIWAGLPNSSGQSHYHGYAGNRATLTWARFEAEMATIFPG